VQDVTAESAADGDADANTDTESPPHEASAEESVRESEADANGADEEVAIDQTTLGEGGDSPDGDDGSQKKTAPTTADG
jgi:hypothetical protein